LRFNVCWRGRRLGVSIDARERRLEAVLEAGDAMILTVAGRGHALAHVSVPLDIRF